MAWLDYLLDAFRSRESLVREQARISALRLLVACTPGDPAEQAKALASLDARAVQIRARLRIY